MITFHDLMALREKVEAEDPVACVLATVGAALWQQLAESNRLAALHTDLLRLVGDEAVTREAEAIARETQRLKMFMTDRDAVLDEVKAALDSGGHRNALWIVEEVRKDDEATLSERPA